MKIVYVHSRQHPENNLPKYPAHSECIPTRLDRALISQEITLEKEGNTRDRCCFCRQDIRQTEKFNFIIWEEA